MVFVRYASYHSYHVKLFAENIIDISNHIYVITRLEDAKIFQALNSDLLDNLRREQIDTAIVYSGNPCQLALVHVLGIPFIYFDLDGKSTSFPGSAL